MPSVVIYPILKKKEKPHLKQKKGDIILIDFKQYMSGINLASHKVKWSAQARFHSINR